MAPNPWFAPQVDNTPPPSWADTGWAVLRAQPTAQGAQFTVNAGMRPDLNWLADHSVEKFGPLLDGLNDDERSWLIENSMSASSAGLLRDQLDARRRDDQTFAHSTTAVGASFVANLLDPVSLAAGAGVGKVAGLIYAAQQYVQSLGRPDGQTFRDERLSLKSILSAGFQRSPDSSVLPMLIDTAINFVDRAATGEDHMLFSNTRNSGLGSNLLDSLPAWRVLGDMGALKDALVSSPLRSDQTFDQKDAQLLRDFVPLARSIGVLNATNALITATFPEKDDEPLVRKAKR